MASGEPEEAVLVELWEDGNSSHCQAGMNDRVVNVPDNNWVVFFHLHRFVPATKCLVLFLKRAVSTKDSQIPSKEYPLASEKAPWGLQNVVYQHDLAIYQYGAAILAARVSQPIYPGDL